MPWLDNEWTSVTVIGVEYILSPEKQTPGLELVCQHHENGEIKGVWWMTNTLSNGIPMWQKVFQRLLLLGCNEADLKAADTWVDHIKLTIIGKTVSVMPETDKYGTKAKFIGVSTGGESKYTSMTGGASPFNAPPSTDDNGLPF